MSTSKRYHQNKNFELREVVDGEEFQLVNKLTNQGFFINPTAALIWSHFISIDSVSEVAGQLASKYGSAEQILDDVAHAAAMFCYHNALIEVEKS